MLQNNSSRSRSGNKSSCTEDNEISDEYVTTFDSSFEARKVRLVNRRWTKEEDDKLKNLVQEYQENWSTISHYFPERTTLQCHQRWHTVVNPELVKGAWTKEEDAAVEALVERYGTKKWTLIARHLKGRLGKQCRERWHNHLNPKIKKTAWTDEEDSVIYEAHQRLGNHWAKIAKLLPGRSDNAVKNHWNSTLLRKLQRNKKAVEGSQVSVPVTGFYNEVQSERDASLRKFAVSFSGSANEQLDSPNHLIIHSDNQIKLIMDTTDLVTVVKEWQQNKLCESEPLAKSFSISTDSAEIKSEPPEKQSLSKLSDAESMKTRLGIFPATSSVGYLSKLKLTRQGGIKVNPDEVVFDSTLDSPNIMPEEIFKNRTNSESIVAPSVKSEENILDDTEELFSTHQTPTKSSPHLKQLPFSPSQFLKNSNQPFYRSLASTLMVTPMKNNGPKSTAPLDNPTRQLFSNIEETFSTGKIKDRRKPEVQHNIIQKSIEEENKPIKVKQSIIATPRTPTPFKKALAEVERRIRMNCPGTPTRFAGDNEEFLQKEEEDQLDHSQYETDSSDSKQGDYSGYLDQRKFSTLHHRKENTPSLEKVRKALSSLWNYSSNLSPHSSSEENDVDCSQLPINSPTKSKTFCLTEENEIYECYRKLLHETLNEKWETVACGKTKDQLHLTLLAYKYINQTILTEHKFSPQ